MRYVDDEDYEEFERAAQAHNDYVVHQEGEQAVHSDGVRRDTQQGKTLYTLLFPKGVPMDEQLFVRVARHYTKGGAKHGNRNWENSKKEDTLEHHTESLWRHFMKFFFDVQDGEDHAAAIVWNVNAVDLTRRNRAKAAADEHTKLCEEIDAESGISHPKEADCCWFVWRNGDRLTEVDPKAGEPGSWVYSAGGDVWYFEESFDKDSRHIDRSARSLSNLVSEFGPLKVTRGRNQGWVINKDGGIEYGVS